MNIAVVATLVVSVSMSALTWFQLYCLSSLYSSQIRYIWSSAVLSDTQLLHHYFNKLRSTHVESTMNRPTRYPYQGSHCLQIHLRFLTKKRAEEARPGVTGPSAEEEDEAALGVRTMTKAT